jgi:hypothetical protein
VTSRFAVAIRLIAILALSFAPTAPLIAQRTARPDGAIAPATLDSPRAHIRRVLDSTKTASVAVAVAKNGRIIWEEGFGFADVERRTPATPTTRFDPPPPGGLAKRAHWVEPRLVAEVQFTEWTGDGRIRHPSLQGFRTDKRPTDVRLERTGVDDST